MNDKIILLQAIVRAVLAVAVVGVGSYLLISGFPIPPEAWKIALLVLGAYFGFEATAAFKKRSNNR
jgi:hypothetical protein